MILGFKTIHEGKPTDFIQKIEAGTKIHTLREDIHDRWKAGRKVQFCTGVRTKKYKEHFTKVCTGIQNVKLVFPLTKDQPYAADLNIYINGELLNPLENHAFIMNDGFTSEIDFLRWFFYEKKKGKWKQRTDSWSGKIIHWTKTTYPTNNHIVVQNLGQQLMHQCEPELSSSPAKS